MAVSSAEREQFVEQVADFIERNGLVAPAVLFLEANKPLSFVASQALLMIQPLLNVALGGRLPLEVATLLEDRKNVESLIKRLERGHR